MNIQYDKNTGQVVFDVAGTSEEVQNVTANIVVSAYGRQIYQKPFNPCEPLVAELCPGMSTLPYKVALVDANMKSSAQR